MSEREDVILDTSMGSIHIELYWDHAPRFVLMFNMIYKPTFYIERVKTFMNS